MRDILTAIASLVILALAAAVVVPPFVDWSAYRPAIDGAIARASGTEARTEGPIEVTLLPAPRLKFETLRLGPERADQPSLVASFVRTEVALSPLLSGDVRFTSTRIGRAEIRVPTAQTGNWRLTSEAIDQARRSLAFDDLAIAQLLITTVAPSTGRTDQFYVENAQLAAPSLAGPWQVEGMAGGAVPFRLVTGELTAERTLQVRLTGGGDLNPRFDLDTRVALAAGSGDDSLVPSASGTARLIFGPPAQVAAAGLPLPVTIQAPFKTVGRDIEVENLTVEAGSGGASLRLGGSARLGLEQNRVSLRLDGRRLDIDSFLLSDVGRELAARSATWSPPPISWPIEVELTLGSVLLAQEELANLSIRGVLDRGRVRLEQAEVTAPGNTRVALTAELGMTTEGGGRGRIAVASNQSDRFARYLNKLGVDPRWTGPLDGKPLEAAADIALASPVTSVRNARLKLGETLLTGNARYAAPGDNGRGRIEAQVSLQGVDIATLPPLASLFDAARDLDVGLIVEAKDVRQGQQPGAGRVTARVLSDGPALVVEALDIENLAGASARVRGRIAPDGSGRITGRLTARRAAPLIDLIGTVWVGGVSRLAPAFLREGDLALDLAVERAGTASTLRTTLRGTAAGGLFEADVLTEGGEARTLNLKLATDNTGRWVDRPDAPLLRRPSNLEIKGVRVASGQFNLTAAGDVAGVRLSTTRPFALSSGDDVLDSGEAELTSADVTPFLVLLGDGAGVAPPVPLQVRVGLGRDRDQTQFSLTGRIAGEGVDARLSATSRADIQGSIAVDRVSLPWIANAFALGTPTDPRASAAWSTARFGQTRRLVDGGQVELKAKTLELGRGHWGLDAAMLVVVGQEGGIAFRNLDMKLAEGRLSGTVAVNRQGSLGSVTGDVNLEDSALPQVLGPGAFEGRLSGTLRFGASGESPAALIANLAGAGSVRIADLIVPRADPAAVDRGLRRILGESDPLAGGRLQAVLAEELSRAPFRSRPFAAQAILVGGALRLNGIRAETGAAQWEGSASVDWRGFALDARGTLHARTAPKDWTGSPPYVGLGFRGPLAQPTREVDAGPLTNGLAAIVLQRELEKIETFEADAHERGRLNGRRDLDRARKQWQDEAARRAAEEAARQAAAAKRAAEEAARQAAADLAARRAAEEAERQARVREQRAAEEASREAARQARIREQQAAEDAARLARVREQQAADEARQARIRDERRRVEEEASRQARLREEAAASAERAREPLPLLTPPPPSFEADLPLAIPGQPGG